MNAVPPITRIRMAYTPAAQQMATPILDCALSRRRGDCKSARLHRF
jgi:hypothetical protein